MLIPIILSGGAGTRLWPVSREAHPKPFMRIGGKSLLTQTYERALAVGPDTAPLLVTNRDYYFLSRDDLRPQQTQPHYLLEPAGRNTGPAIALAALWAAGQDEDACLLVMPADHLVRDVTAFVRSARKAEQLAQDGFLTLFGIRPQAPESGFGYVRLGAAVGFDAHLAERFIEKPDPVTAAAYIAAGDHVWNSGMFCFKARTILDAYAAWHPELLDAARAVWNRTERDGERLLLPEEFAKLDNISIDYAVMEKAGNIAVVAADFDWSDIGAWKAVAEAIPADEHGNTGNQCDAIVIDSRNTHLEAGDRLVVAIGLDNLLVVDTPDALLVADKSRSQQVKEAVARLKASNHDAHKLHRTVARPWGSYTVLEEGPGFKIKRLVVKPHASLSLQMHHRRSEHWVVVSGTADVINGDQQARLQANQSTYIPAGNRHRLHNSCDVELILIEVQCGAYLGEDDIVRYEDIYGRARPEPNSAARIAG